MTRGGDAGRDALRLLYVVDAAAADDRDHLEAACRGGVTALWLRIPDATGALLFERAAALRALTRAHGVALFVGDRLDVALLAEADGVQAGHRAPPIERLRTHCPLRLGASCHDATSLDAAVRAGVDHVVLSPVREVPGKGAPLGVEGFGALAAGLGLPVVALGGIGPEEAAAVASVGAAGVAVHRALRDARDPAASAQALRRGLERGSSRMTSR